MTKYLTLSLLFLFPAFGFTQSKTISLTADQILKKSAESYSAKRIYMDSGKVVSEFYKMDHPHKSAKIFRTAYSASLGFNFEYYEPNKSNSLYTINKTGNLVRTWWGIKNKVDTTISLSRALAGASGVSSATAYIVPRLLLPTQFDKSNFYSGLKATAFKNESISGNKCYVISGSKNGDKINLWISQQDFLIRKIVTDKIIIGRAQQERADLAFQKSIDRLKKQLAAEANPEKRNQISKSIKNLEEVIKLLKNRPSGSKPFSVKTTYYYYPYQPKTIDKRLFSFRPNREVPV